MENKLEKLERKASKYREKRLALQHGQKSSDNNPKSSDSEAGHSSSRSRSRDKEEKRKLEEQKQLTKLKGDEEPKMDARPVNIQTSIPHMVGGEVYLHQWDVQNTGQDQWTSLVSVTTLKWVFLTRFIFADSTALHLGLQETGAG